MCIEIQFIVLKTYVLIVQNMNHGMVNKMPSFVKYYSLNRKKIKHTPINKKRERERSEK